MQLTHLFASTQSTNSSRISGSLHCGKEDWPRMDEDDDFFDMRSRFKMPEKRQKRPLGQDEESNSDSSSSGALPRSL
jgi:hypothetical protein